MLEHIKKKFFNSKNLTDAKKEEIEIVLDQLEEVKRNFSQPIVDGILGSKNADK